MARPIVFDSTSVAPVMTSFDTIYVEELISSDNNTPLDTPSKGMLVTSSNPSGSTIPKLAPPPTLMPLASSIPSFLHYFTYTSFSISLVLIGQHQECVEMVSQYPEALVGLKMLEGDNEDASSLKKQMEEMDSSATSSDQ
ncbi:unnamed protein product [Lactuca saligna]|uniref:Uncharacterized protein n=1 Tax=Lactuca saligna TaxID=75948 RepID=A0AA35YH17_LACSI|nr:unnamed protein product [Lactuca saligna]